MITEEQRRKHFVSSIGAPLNPRWAVLNKDYLVRSIGIIVPKGTIVQVELYTVYDGDLYLNGQVVDKEFPYDAATLLEE